MYPKQVDKFIPWSKAMVAGATVAKPHYPGTKKPGKTMRKKRVNRRRRRKQNGSKE